MSASVAGNRRHTFFRSVFASAFSAALRARLETPSALAAQAASPRPEAPAAPPSATRTPPQAEAGVEAANFSRMARLEPKP